MKKIISTFLLVTVLTLSLGISVSASGIKPQASFIKDTVSHYTDVMPIKFKLTDDKSLKDGFFVFLSGNPASSNCKQLYAERITEDSNSVVLTREIDITPCKAKDYSEIYLVVIDADGNESEYNTSTIVKTNDWSSPAIRVKNPTTDNSADAYRVYTGSYPSFTPAITITDYISNTFTCNCYVDSILKETKIVSFSRTGTNEMYFNKPIDIASLSNGYHNIKFEVFDGYNVGTYSFKILKY